MNRLIMIFVSLTIVLFTLLSLPAYATSNQDLHQSALLIAPEADTIGIYTRPGKQQSRIGDAKAGTHVTVLEQTGSNEGYLWDRVEFEQATADSTAALIDAGWVRADYVSVAAASPVVQSMVQSTIQSYEAQPQAQSDEVQVYKAQDDRIPSQSKGSWSDHQQDQTSPNNQQNHYAQQQPEDMISAIKRGILNVFKRS